MAGRSYILAAGLAWQHFFEDGEENMYFAEDNTYNEIREKSLEQWLEDMENHEDICVRGGIPLVRSYLKTLQDENARLKEENELKNSYLKKMSKR